MAAKDKLTTYLLHLPLFPPSWLRSRLLLASSIVFRPYQFMFCVGQGGFSNPIVCRARHI